MISSSYGNMVHMNSQLFIDHLNNCVPSIKFEANISDSVINFLDVKVLLENNTISTTLYTKETETLSYLVYSSCHPTFCKKSIPYSQFLRFRRICSDLDDFVVQSEKLALSFHKGNYPDHIIQEGFDKAFLTDREKLLNSRGKDKSNPLTQGDLRSDLQSNLSSTSWLDLLPDLIDRL